MKLFLSGFSAFEYWTALRLGAQPRFKPARAVTLEQCAHTNRDVLAFAQRPGHGPTQLANRRPHSADRQQP